MEQTFMTIHNLSLDANILFASDSIIDILGYHPHQVQGKSCFEFFHPEEVPSARSIHSRGVLLDKAAVLHYLRIQASDGQWVSCECCFTVVHDVLVACTSIYRRGEKSERRAIEAPQVRRIFSCSPRDPRYHMLEHLSPKFRMPPSEREPRAALILNRFTRSVTIMYATNSVSTILGLDAHVVQGKSFYECIDLDCLAEAVKCLESAKANDSIAYLRFWYRDPRREEDFHSEDDESDDSMDLDDEGEEDEEEHGQVKQEEEEDTKGGRRRGIDGEMMDENSDDSDGGAYIGNGRATMDLNASHSTHIKSEPLSPEFSTAVIGPPVNRPTNGVSQGPSSSHDRSRPRSSTRSSHRQGQQEREPSAHDQVRRRRRRTIPTFELEAIVSCSCDGLVVVIRKARPAVPNIHPPMQPMTLDGGLFAAPWGEEPIHPAYPPGLQYRYHSHSTQHMPPQEHNAVAIGGPPMDQLMRSIQDVAVFAWALVGINGSLAEHARGTPQDEAQPPHGLPVWDPSARDATYSGPENQAVKRWAQSNMQNRQSTSLGQDQAYHHVSSSSSAAVDVTPATSSSSAARGFGSSTSTASYQFRQHDWVPRSESFTQSYNSAVAPLPPRSQEPPRGSEHFSFQQQNWDNHER